LFSFRNHGEFHEDVINRIFKDLWNLLEPKFMRIIGNFNVRGGIAIKPLVQKFGVNITPEEHQELLEMMLGWDNSKKTINN
jgi:7-cyano-7-deazaguanine reductase